MTGTKAFRYPLLVLLVCLTALLAVSGCGNSSNQGSTQGTSNLTFAVATELWYQAPVLVAEDEDIFSKNNLNVKILNEQTGLAAKNALLSGSADIAFVSSPPLALKPDEPVVVLCRFMSSTDLVALIRRKSALSANNPDSIPEPIALVPDTTSQWFLYDYMNNKSMLSSQNFNDLNFLNVQPPDVDNALQNNSANSAVIWEPFPSQLPDNIKNDFTYDRAPGLYTYEFYIITTQDIYQQKKDAIDAFITSLEQSSNEIQNNPTYYRLQMEDRFKYQRDSLKDFWDTVDFSISKDKTAISKVIEGDAQTAAQIHNQNPTPPSSFDHMFQYLE